jgi:2-polyprenyl-3-methyl-5-hydroxy-6-metoxy-1,4-benzoquinol methylase
MPAGPLIRSLFGPYERTIAEVYRRMFVDLDHLTSIIQTWAPQARNILEVGCGEGAMTERLAKIYPTATITAIDITPRVGRLFQGDRRNVNFSQESVESVASRQPASFDLVILADVIHHVPFEARQSIMRAINEAMTPDGKFVFKDWLITRTPIHWLCQASDQYLTGDKVSYLTEPIIESLVTDPFGAGTIRKKTAVSPWSNNVAVLIHR